MERVVRSVSTGRVGFPRSSWLLWLIAFCAQASWAADALQYTKNYFVTGDYKVAGVGLRGKGGADGFATGTLTLSGVPAGADIVAAFLYWQTEEPEPLPNLAKGFFDGQAIVGDVRGNANNDACWSSGGTVREFGRSYRADVLRYLPIDPVNNVRLANGAHTVRLKDSGGNGNGQVDYTNGATLVVVYRVLNSTAPLRSVVIYDGAYTMSKATPSVSQDVAGFYEAATNPAARLTHIVGNGQPRFGSSINYPGGVGNNALTGSLGARLDAATFDMTLPAAASSFTTTATTNDNQACFTWVAIIASMNVADSDGDGLLDTWEKSGLHLNEGTATQKATFGGCSDYPAEPCVNLPGMGALSTQKDLFLEIDWLQGSDHLHIPKLAALKRIGDRFAEHGIRLHFDLGTYGGYSTGASPYIIPSNLTGAKGGGEVIDEASLSCPNAQTKVCAFPGRVALGWKIGFRAVKEGFPALGLQPHFAHNRKDVFHYVLFSHALGGPYDSQGRGLTADPWSVSGVADRPGGDLMISLGLWRADNPLNCNPTVNCNDQTGSELTQAGTLMHELGHNLNLLHAGNSRSPNCEPNYQSTMNYLYQTRGLTDAAGQGQIDFSNGAKPSLLETFLNGFTPGNLTYRVRFFGPPNAEDVTLNRTTKRYCTNGATARNQQMRLESNADMKTIDWSNGTSGFAFSYDVNFDGTTNAAFNDFNDWANLNLRQIGARTNVGGLSTDVGQEDLGQEDLGQEDLGQEDLGQEDLGQEDLGQEDLGQEDLGDTDTVDVDYDSVIATLDATDTANPLQASSSLTAITLTWSAPSIGQIRTYNIFRTADTNGVFSANELTTPFATLNGAPPATSFVDTVDGTTTKYNTKYTYFLQAIDINGTKSGGSNKVNGIVKHLFVTADNQSRIYGAANPALTYTVTGLDPGLTGTITCTTTATQPSKPGQYPITCSGLTPILGVTFTAGTLTITGAPLKITASTNNKQYDGTLTATALPVVEGLIGNDQVTNLVEAYTDRNVGTGKTLVVTSYTINDGNNGGNYDVTLVPNSTGIITQAPVSGLITANDKVYNKTTAATLATCTLNGLFTIDNGAVGCVATSAAFSSANAGTWTVAATLTLTGSGAGNYKLNSTAASTTGAITKATPTIVVNGGRYSYDGLPHPATGSVTGVGGEFLGTPTFTYTPGGASAPVEVGSYTAVSVSPETANYFGVSGGPVSIKIDGFVATGSMGTARSNHTATLLPNGKVLVAGGADASGTALANAELYDPAAGTFGPTVNNMPNKAVGHSATLLNSGKVLIAGGGNSSAQLYDPVTNSFSAIGGMAAQRSFHTATLLADGKVLLAGGTGNNGATSNTAQIYDPVSGNFTSTANMKAAREYHTATLLAGGKVLLAGGRTKSGNGYVYLSSAELYDPVTNTFTAVSAAMSAARFAHIAVPVTAGPNSGKVLIAGGANSAALATTELYDPATNTFAPTGSLSTARQYLTASPISNGILVAGGLNSSGRVGTGQVYQGSAFVGNATMKAARSAHTATVLSDGNVLVVGGQASSGTSTVTAELYKVTP